MPKWIVDPFTPAGGPCSYLLQTGAALPGLSVPFNWVYQDGQCCWDTGSSLAAWAGCPDCTVWVGGRCQLLFGSEGYLNSTSVDTVGEVSPPGGSLANGYSLPPWALLDPVNAGGFWNVETANGFEPSIPCLPCGRGVVGFELYRADCLNDDGDAETHLVPSITRDELCRQAFKNQKTGPLGTTVETSGGVWYDHNMRLGPWDTETPVTHTNGTDTPDDFYSAYGIWQQMPPAFRAQWGPPCFLLTAAQFDGDSGPLEGGVGSGTCVRIWRSFSQETGAPPGPQPWIRLNVKEVLGCPPWPTRHVGTDGWSVTGGGGVFSYGNQAEVIEIGAGCSPAISGPAMGVGHPGGGVAADGTPQVVCGPATVERCFFEDPKFRCPPLTDEVGSGDTLTCEGQCFPPDCSYLDPTGRFHLQLDPDTGTCVGWYEGFYDDIGPVYLHRREARRGFHSIFGTLTPWNDESPEEAEANRITNPVLPEAWEFGVVVWAHMCPGVTARDWWIFALYEETDTDPHPDQLRRHLVAYRTRDDGETCEDFQVLMTTDWFGEATRGEVTVPRRLVAAFDTRTNEALLVYTKGAADEPETARLGLYSRCLSWTGDEWTVGPEGLVTLTDDLTNLVLQKVGTAYVLTYFNTDGKVCVRETRSLTPSEAPVWDAEAEQFDAIDTPQTVGKPGHPTLFYAFHFGTSAARGMRCFLLWEPDALSYTFLGSPQTTGQWVLKVGARDEDANWSYSEAFPVCYSKLRTMGNLRPAEHGTWEVMIWVLDPDTNAHKRTVVRLSAKRDGPPVIEFRPLE